MDFDVSILVGNCPLHFEDIDGNTLVFNAGLLKSTHVGGIVAFGGFRRFVARDFDHQVVDLQAVARGQYVFYRMNGRIPVTDRCIAMHMRIIHHAGHNGGYLHRTFTVHPNKFNAAVRRRRFKFKAYRVAGV